MSETIATRMVSTVLRVRGFCRIRVLWPVLLTGALAELGVRLLRPRERLLEPAPVRLEEYFSAEEVERGSGFARPQLALGLARAVLQLVALAVAARRARRLGAARPANPYAGGALAGAGLAAGLTIVSLPVRAVSRRRSIAVGLVTQSWRGWAVDLIKAGAIESAMVGGAAAAVLVLTRRYPRTWWLPAGVGSVAVGTLLGALAPVLLDPVFNHFTPLPEGQLRSDVLALADAAGVRVGEVYEVDASRRTTAANAYVTGLGPTKRVVLFDTLTDRYSRDEVRVVVAHELAHVRHRDVLRGLAFGAVIAPAAAFAVQRLSSSISSELGTPSAVPALALAAAMVSAPVGLIGNRLSRALERRADAYSLTLSGAPEAFISFERAIALQNVADLRPPRWVSALLATHPPTLERIGAAVSFALQNGQAAS
jgi:STE24 endopeptidase